jgi:HEAT repeat protein
MGNDPAAMGADPVERAATFAATGLQGRCSDADVAVLARAVADDPDPRARAAALGALVRGARRADARTAWLHAARDDEPAVRRRAAELAPALGRHVPVRALLTLLSDADASVAEAAAFALGERVPVSARAIDVLARTSGAHEDPLVREAAVAALGALGDERGRAAILDACTDKPAIRRRAVLALASFDGDDVDTALRRALDDPDWQVRQAAEDLSVEDRQTARHTER